MLRNSLPTIITDKVPGPNACVLLKKGTTHCLKRSVAIHILYVSSVERAQCSKMLTETSFLILSEVSAFSTSATADLRS